MKPYKQYKDSGVEWIGEIPCDWEVGKPYRYCKIIRGNSNFKKDDLKLNADFVAVQYGKIYKIEILDENYNFYVDKVFYKKGQTIKNGNIIFITTSEVIEELGHCCYYNRNDVGLLGGEQIALIPSNEYFINKMFFYVSMCFKYQIKQYATGTKVYRVNMEDLKRISIPLPPLQTQQKIVDYLDEKTKGIDNLITDKENLVTLLTEQRQAIISETVTKGLDPNAPMKDSGIEWIGEIPCDWEVVPFKYSLSTKTGISITKAEFTEDGILCVNYGDIHSKYNFDLDLERDVLKYAPYELLAIKKTSLANENDFIFCDTSEDIEGCGNNTLIENTNNKLLFSGSHTILAKPTKEFYSRFIAYLFATDKWKAQIRSKVYGVKVFSITQTILKSTILFFPPIEEQQKIVDYLDQKTSQIDSLIKDTTKQITLLKEYRQSLISEVVTGKVEI